ncbi:MAG: sterol desaturase family protein [Gammaproteobacteria bacterium]|nr:sterol desaturase family protein [Gammaproteobacteria bacterium]
MPRLALDALIRWGSYPLVFGGSAAAILAALQAGMPYWPTTPLVAAAALVIVALLERRLPYRAAWLQGQDDTRTDILHALVNLSVVQFAATVLTRLGDLVPAEHRVFPSAWPLWAQLLLAALVVDFGLYAMHYASHRSAWLWRLHAPHHSAERLYWLNGERRHPLHAVLMAGPGLLALALAGAPSAVVAAWLGILTVHLAFQHANLDYRVGALRHVLGVAESHRWHHKREFEDAQVNFGEFLLLWDRLLGTYHDGADRLGESAVGLKERDYPKDYLGQLRAPFRRA